MARILFDGDDPVQHPAALGVLVSILNWHNQMQRVRRFLRITRVWWRDSLRREQQLDYAIRRSEITQRGMGISGSSSELETLRISLRRRQRRSRRFENRYYNLFFRGRALAPLLNGQRQLLAEYSTLAWRSQLGLQDPGAGLFLPFYRLECVLDPSFVEFE